MSKGNTKKTKSASGYQNALTGATYTKASSNAKATKAASDFAKANPKKTYYA